MDSRPPPHSAPPKPADSSTGDSGSADNPAPQKTRILILKSHPLALKAVESFLQNRDMVLFSTANLKQALSFLLKEKPQFFLLAADYPNKKVRLLPKLLSKNIKTIIMGYTEGSNNASLFALQELNAEYVLYPPISGPAIIRTIARIAKEIEKARMAEIRDRLKRVDFTKEENPKEAEFLKNDYSFDLQEFQDLLQTEILIQEPAEGPKNPTDISAKVSSKDPVSGKDVTVAKSESPNPANQLTSLSLPGPESKSASLSRGESAVVKESIREMARVFQSAMDNIRQLPEPFLEVEKVSSTEKMACLVVEAGPLKGYLLVAFGAGQTMDQPFMQGVRDGFLSVARQQGINLESPLIHLKPMELSTQMVQFLSWAEPRSEFLLTTSHGQQEVMAAFLSHPQIPTRFEKSEDGKMCALELQQLAVDQVLEFDVFVHLPNNEKYVLYNRKGQTMFSDQQKRLLDRGVSKIHFRSEDVNDYYHYQAQNYVNASILDFTQSMTN